MLVAGAKGHALEILDILLQQFEAGDIVFFDNVSSSFTLATINRFSIISTSEEVQQLFKKDNRFVLGTGNPVIRKKMAEHLTGLGGVLTSVVSGNAVISKLNVQLGAGLNIMHNVTIQPEVIIGNGTLINAGALIHHEVVIGNYCEICPGAIVTGNVKIGDNTFVGSGCIILPGLTIGNNVKIGAGAVVLKNIAAGITVAGNPARQIEKLQ